FWWIEPAHPHEGQYLYWLLDVAAGAGLGGVWVWWFVWQLKQRPLLPLYAPSEAEAPSHEGLRTQHRPRGARRPAGPGAAAAPTPPPGGALRAQRRERARHPVDGLRAGGHGRRHPPGGVVAVRLLPAPGRAAERGRTVPGGGGEQPAPGGARAR